MLHFCLYKQWPNKQDQVTARPTAFKMQPSPTHIYLRQETINARLS